MTHRRCSIGFTILELIATLAIAAILLMYAVPSYRSYVARGHRIDAASALYRAAQFVESNPAARAAALPSEFDQAPRYGAAVYRLRVLLSDETNGGYAVEAVPVETGLMRDDPCGTFVLHATGLRSNRAAAHEDSPGGNDCWNTR
jgi:type IV pilus assembly protein PilE